MSKNIIVYLYASIAATISCLLIIAYTVSGVKHLNNNYEVTCYSGGRIIFKEVVEDKPIVSSSRVITNNKTIAGNCIIVENPKEQINE